MQVVQRVLVSSFRLGCQLWHEHVNDWLRVGCIGETSLGQVSKSKIGAFADLTRIASQGLAELLGDWYDCTLVDTSRGERGDTVQRKRY